MTAIRDPRQVRNLDAITLRREMKQLLAADVILDREEERELLDLSNQQSRYNVLRVALLRAALGGGQRPRTLTDQERLALGLFVMGEGPRPRFALFATSDGHYGQHHVPQDDPDAIPPAPPWPAKDPNEPNRYVQPRGEYAIPGDRP